MCGLCGFVEPANEDARRATRAIARMTRALDHRGPDGCDTEVLTTRSSKRVALGHARLAIIDLSDAAREPMKNDDGTISLVYNGEVYNFPALRASLEAKGHRFRSRCDSEVVLRLYEEKGEDFVRDLEGIFALAIVDQRRDKVILARDPLGTKPLYYAERAGTLVFASEIKSILASGKVDAEPDWQAISDYFTFLYVPAPETVFRAIRQLPPAHTLTFNLTTGASKLARYWRVRKLPDVARASYDDAQAMLRDELAGVVKRQLVSDVPLGVFLSAGIDSTVIAGLARKHGDVHSFTVTFDDPALAFYDEREGARAASRHLGTIHEELPIDRVDPFDLLDTLRFFDQPFGNPTSHLVYLLSKRAKERITVALCGAGGDELFAGYPRYRAERLARALRFIPARALRGVGAVLSRVKDSHRTMRLRRVKEFFAGYDDDPIERFASWTYFLDERTKSRLLGPHDVRAASRVLRDLAAASELPDHDARMLEVDVGSFLDANLLEYTNRASMAAGLEVRVPLLDHRFVEMALNLPFSYKLRGRRTKAVFRDAFADMVSPEQSKLPGASAKRGFNVPLALYMRELDAYFDAPAKLRDRFGDHVGVTWKNGVVDRAVIDELRAAHRNGRADNSSELFAIMMFDRWWGEYIEPATTRAAHDDGDDEGDGACAS